MSTRTGTIAYLGTILTAVRDRARLFLQQLLGRAKPPPEETTFPLYQRLPDELKIIVWEQFVKSEAASRIVPLNVSLGDFGDPSVVPDDHWLVLSLMPLRRLVSPALSVCLESRKAALRHYRTRVNIYEMPLHPHWQSFEDFVEERSRWRERNQDQTTLGPARADLRRRFFRPLVTDTQPVWADRASYTDRIGERILYRASDDLCSGPDEDDTHETEEEETRAQQEFTEDANYRGCVYLDLATDRFMDTSQWCAVWPTEKLHYGFRELSDSLNDFKYNGGVPLDEST
ncbi:hypothetical protein PG993_006237 [Apiospora rasikravindrae]|uniref:2EXR domain-containing protein n=1 Tax=Apiospora rasikravindrae TaxID=990691 RepID=A0ABR1T547_9PEZI